ncbi:hypothetical protein [Azospirillum palustre]
MLDGIRVARLRRSLRLATGKGDRTGDGEQASAVGAGRIRRGIVGARRVWRSGAGGSAPYPTAIWSDPGETVALQVKESFGDGRWCCFEARGSEETEDAKETKPFMTAFQRSLQRSPDSLGRSTAVLVWR